MLKFVSDKHPRSQWMFYDTHVSRADVLKLIKLERSPAEFRQYIVSNILSKWHQKDRSENRDNVFIELLCQLYRFMDQQRYSAEQISCLFSLTLEVVIKSMERKMTQTDSFHLLREVLAEQTKIFSCESLPLFKPSDAAAIAEFLKATFYRQYSHYEITMTKFIDMNIDSKTEFCDFLPPIISLHGAQIIDKPQDYPLLAAYFASAKHKSKQEAAIAAAAEVEEQIQAENQASSQKEQQEALFSAENNKQPIQRGSNDTAVTDYVQKRLEKFAGETSLLMANTSQAAFEQANTILNPKKK